MTGRSYARMFRSYVLFRLVCGQNQRLASTSQQWCPQTWTSFTTFDRSHNCRDCWYCNNSCLCAKSRPIQCMGYGHRWEMFFLFVHKDWWLIRFRLGHLSVFVHLYRHQHNDFRGWGYSWEPGRSHGRCSRGEEHCLFWCCPRNYPYGCQILVPFKLYDIVRYLYWYILVRYSCILLEPKVEKGRHRGKDSCRRVNIRELGMLSIDGQDSGENHQIDSCSQMFFRDFQYHSMLAKWECRSRTSPLWSPN